MPLGLPTLVGAVLRNLRRPPLHLQVLIGAVLGIVAGLVLEENAAALQPVADLFVQLLRMLVAPLIFVTLSFALIGAEGRAAGRIGARAVAYNLATLGIALAVGITFGVLLGPGRGAGTAAVQSLGEGFAAPEHAGEPRSALDILFGIVPRNVVGAFVEGEVLQILFLAIVFGLAVNAVGRDRLRPVVEVLRGAHDLLYRVVHWVVRLSPFGVFAILAAVVGRSGLDILGTLAWYFVVVLLATLVQVFGVHGSLIRFLARQRYRDYLRALREPLPIAFAALSTAAALPVSMASVPRETRISERVAGFALPFGAAVGRDSSGIYQVVSVVCIAQLSGNALGVGDLGILWFTAILSSLAVSAVPAASFVNLTILLDAMGLPVHLSALVFAMDRPLDHLRTSGNLMGQFANAVVTGALTGEIRPVGGSPAEKAEKEAAPATG